MTETSFNETTSNVVQHVQHSDDAGGIHLMRADRRGKQVAVHLVESSSNPSGYQLVSANRVTKCGDHQDLVELARQIQTAEDFVRARAHGRLEVIAEQMRFLQAQAKRVLQEAKRDDVLHHAACNMKKVPGTIYYLYERQSGQMYMSLVSPKEWGEHGPYKFHGCYRLEADMSWTPEDKLEKRAQDIDFLDNVLHTNKAFLPSIEGAFDPIVIKEAE